MFALLSLLDDYICISNTNTHLYASLQDNKKAKILVPDGRDWIWSNENYSSPWFNAEYKIYRPNEFEEWNLAE
jgi:hypothetical protein